MYLNNILVAKLKWYDLIHRVYISEIPMNPKHSWHTMLYSYGIARDIIHTCQIYPVDTQAKTGAPGNA